MEGSCRVLSEKLETTQVTHGSSLSFPPLISGLPLLQLQTRGCQSLEWNQSAKRDFLEVRPPSELT